MLLCFDTRVERVCKETRRVVIRPTAAIDEIEIGSATRLAFEDGHPATQRDLRPGDQLFVCGPDPGGNRLRAQRIILRRKRPRVPAPPDAPLLLSVI